MPYTLHPHIDCTRFDEAVELMLNHMPDFDAYGVAIVKLGQLSLPHFEIATMVALVGPSDEHGDGHCIGLSSARRFRARRAIEPLAATYRIERLDGATVDQDSNVTLCDGTHVYDVRLDKHEMPADLTDGERWALVYSLTCQEGSDEIDFELSYGALTERIAEARIPPLPVLVAHVEALRKCRPELRPVSTEVFRTALWKAGKRRPLNRG